MAVEKISAAEPLNNRPVVEQRTENKEVSVSQSKGNTKDIVTVLSILSAIGAAGVAIYKHKNAKKMVEEAEQAAKKKIEEAEQKAKQAEEETENKIKEAVKKVVNEYEKNKKINDTSKSTGPKKKIKTDKSDKTKKTQEVEKKTPKILEGGILDDSLNEVDTNFLEHVKNGRNGIIVVPAATRLSEFFVRVNKSLKNKINHIKGKKASEKVESNIEENTEKTAWKDKIKNFWGGLNAKLKFTYKKLETKINPEEKTSKLETYGEKISITAKQTKDYIIKKWNSFLELFKRKKESAPPLEITEEGEKVKQNIRKQLDGKTDYEKLANNLINEPHTESEHDRLQALYSTLAVQEPKLSEIFKGIKIPEAKDISEKDLITEYNALSKIVKDLPAEDVAVQRYLEITDELLNHRGYKIQSDGQIKKIVPKKEAVEIDNVPLKEISDLDLLIEYNILRKKVQQSSVMAKESRRFLEIQGELINHRGYKIQPDGKLKRINSRKDSVIDRIKRFFRI